jgi:hypothetical protein
MKRIGYFNVTKELLNSPLWDEIKASLKDSFEETHRIHRDYGIVEVHGYSELFKDQSPGVVHQYDLKMTRTKGGFKIQCNIIVTETRINGD